MLRYTVTELWCRRLACKCSRDGRTTTNQFMRDEPLAPYGDQVAYRLVIHAQKSANSFTFFGGLV